MDMTINLFTTQNEILPQLSDISTKNQDDSIMIGFELTEKPIIDAGEELPLPGNDVPVDNLILNFKNVLKESLIQTQEHKSLNYIETANIKNEIEEESKYILANDFLYLEKPFLDLKEIPEFHKGTVSNNEEVLNIKETDVERLQPNNILLNDEVKKLAPATDVQSISQSINQFIIHEENDKETIELKDFTFLDSKTEEVSPIEMKASMPHEKLPQTTQHANDNAQALLNAKTDKIIQPNFSTQTSDNEKVDSNNTLVEEPDFNVQLSLAQTNHVKKELELSSMSNEEIVSSKNFEQDLSKQVQIMINTNENIAKVNIDPPELGQIEIKIVQDADKTHIMFFANLEQTHDLIEAGLMRLRMQMEAQGLQLGNVSVSYYGSENNSSHTAKQHTNHQTFFSTNKVENPQHPTINVTSNGLLDLYV